MRSGAALNPALRRGIAARAGHLVAAAAMALAASVLFAGCGADPRVAEPVPTAVDVPTEVTSARAQLATLAAAAEDRKLTAAYILSVADAPARTVTVTVALDGGWRFDVPGGALGGTADVSVARTRDGLFQCALPSASRPITPTCVRVGGPDGRLPARIDPRVQHPFVDWPSVLTDRQAPLAVDTSQPLPGVPGTCFSVDTTSASLTAPLDIGIYCYDTAGTLTGARLAFGTLVLTGTPAPAPATVELPGVVVTDEPLGVAAPPSPTATATGVPG